MNDLQEQPGEDAVQDLGRRWACTGARLFDGKDPQLLLRKHVRCAPVPMRKRRPDLVIPRALDELVLACLEKPPSRRPGSMEEIAAVLRVIAARVLAN